MFLAVVHSASGERRWSEAPARGMVTIGSAIEGDLHITGHNIALRHVVLHFEPRRVVIEMRHRYAVRVDGRPPPSNTQLGLGEHTILAIDPAFRRWHDDLRIRILRRPAIEMGQPTRR